MYRKILLFFWYRRVNSKYHCEILHYALSHFIPQHCGSERSEDLVQDRPSPSLKAEDENRLKVIAEAIFLALLSIVLASTQVFAELQVSRKEIICATLDSIEFNSAQRLTLEQVPPQNLFSDFSLRSPFSDILSLTNSISPTYYLSEYRGQSAWSLGFESSYIKYEEPGVMKEEGAMYGISGSWSSCGEIISRKFMLGLEGKFSWGEVDYQNSGTINDIDDYMLELRALGGFYSPAFDLFTLKPYFGFGYRYLNDDTSGRISSTGARGYGRESNYFYSPMGLEVSYEFPQDWLIAMTLEYDLFWTGTQKSHLSDADLGFSDVKNAQNDGYGFRASARLEKKTKYLDILIEPFYKYWSIDESERSNVSYDGTIWGSGYEPENNSTEIGGRFAVRF